MPEHSMALKLECFWMVLGVDVSQIDLIPNISTAEQAGIPMPANRTQLLGQPQSQYHEGY
jgi:hypothetical protein